MEDNNVVWSQTDGASQSEIKGPVQRILLNGSSKSSSAHGSIRKGSNTNSLNSSEKDESLTELPKVHASPKKSSPIKEKEMSDV